MRRTRSAPSRRSAAIAVLVVILAAGAVSAPVADAADADGDEVDTTVEVTPVGAAGVGVPSNSRAADVGSAGYDEREYYVSGRAGLYEGSSAGPARPTGEELPYTTRVLVRAPADDADFSGRVVVEPFNTSAARDNDAAWGMLGERLLENGDAWMGVTVRNPSVSALQMTDAARYESMDISSNGQAWDMLSSVARLVRSRDGADRLGVPPAEHVYMTGYSQSAVDVVTYANALNPRAGGSGTERLYDGYLLMGRAASATPLDSGTDVLPKLEFRPVGKGTSPIIDVESQSDVSGFTTPQYTNPGGATARRPDRDAPGDRFRLYEVPGSAHAARIPSCDHQGTTFPLRYFERAALENLYAWSERGRRPPRVERIETTAIDTVATLAVDENGNALGGVRSPFLEEPLARYEGSDTPGPLCGLAGVETPLDAATLGARYDGVDDYVQEFSDGLDEAIDARILLRDDRAAILDEAEGKASQVLGGS